MTKCINHIPYRYPGPIFREKLSRARTVYIRSAKLLTDERNLFLYCFSSYQSTLALLLRYNYVRIVLERKSPSAVYVPVLLCTPGTTTACAAVSWPSAKAKLKLRVYFSFSFYFIFLYFIVQLRWLESVRGVHYRVYKVLNN